MTSALSAVPVPARRRGAAGAAVGAIALATCGLLPLALPAPLLLTVLGVMCLVAAALLALVAWGLLRSVRLDASTAALDAVLSEAAGCTCGHEHDKDELSVRAGGGTDICAAESCLGCDHPCLSSSDGSS